MKVRAVALPVTQWQTLEWREGNNFTLRSRFARVRVRAAHRAPRTAHRAPRTAHRAPRTAHRAPRLPT